VKQRCFVSTALGHAIRKVREEKRNKNETRNGEHQLLVYAYYGKT
jgi:hypothetical protein